MIGLNIIITIYVFISKRVVMNKKTHKMMLISGVVATLSFLPGCMSKSDSAASITEQTNSDDNALMTGEVLVTLKGKPVITVDTLAVEKEKFFKANPQVKAALGFMDPKAFERNLLEGLVGQRIADEYVVSNKINQTAEYQAELKDLCVSMERMLNAKFFSEKTSVSVSDSEVQAFYDANKDKLRGVLVSAGGVAAQGIEFSSAAGARGFVAKAKGAQGSFAKAAQEDGLTSKIKDFKLVNNQSVGLDEVLRDKIVAIKTVPTVEMIDANGAFWVVFATAKEEPKYLPFEQIKAALKQELEKNKRVEIFEKEIDALRQQYDVVVNEDYFKAEAAPSEEQESAVVSGGMANAPASKDAVDKRLA